NATSLPRCRKKKGSPVTRSAPIRFCVMVANAASMSPSVLASTMLIFCPMARAASSTFSRSDTLGGLFGFASTAITVAVGSSSCDHLVGAAREGQRHGNAERLGGLEVEDQLDLRGLLHRQVSGLLAPENAPGVETGQTVRLLAHQTAGGGELAQKIDCWDAVAEGECAELRGVAAEQRIGAADHERGYSQLRRRCEGCFEVGFGARVEYTKPHAECVGYGLQVFRNRRSDSVCRVDEQSKGPRPAEQLTREFEPLRPHFDA